MNFGGMEGNIHWLTSDWNGLFTEGTAGKPAARPGTTLAREGAPVGGGTVGGTVGKAVGGRRPGRAEGGAGGGTTEE